MSPKVKVVEIAESTTAGVHRHLFDLVTHLDRDRFSVSVIASALRDRGFLTDIAAMNQKGVGVTIVPMHRNIQPALDVLSLLRIRRALLATKPDIVHTHSSKGGFLGRLAARMARVPVVIHTPHVFPFEMEVPWRRKALYRFLERRAARWTDRFICVSGHEHRRATSCGLAAPEKFALIENGIDADRPAPTPDPAAIRSGLGLAPTDLVVGTVGRLTPQKGLPDLIRAARVVAARVPAARFVLVGDGEMKETLQAAVETQGVRSHFVFAGSREDVLSLYPVFDVFVMPSLWESLPYALLEAMAAGNAIVATEVGGIPEAITHGQQGLLVPPGDSPALAGAIIRLLENAGERKTLGAEARRRVRTRYRLDSMVQSVQDLYLGALDAKRPSA